MASLMHLGRCCHCTPPVPYPGSIVRYMQPTAITDTEGLQTASNWATGNYRTHVAVNPNSGFPLFEFLGSEMACYVYALDVPSGTGNVSVITQPIRWSIFETNTNGAGFEMWRTSNLVNGISGGYEPGGNVLRGPTQPFAQNTFLPVSGNSHADATDPYLATFNQVWNACELHVVYLNGTYVGNSGGITVLRPNKCYIRPAHVQWRVNGTAVGAVQNLYDYMVASAPVGTAWASFFDGLYYAGQLLGNDAFGIPFPSGHETWQNYGDGNLDNWNLEFDAGDTIELDVWYEIAAQRVSNASRKFCVSFSRYATNNNQQLANSVTPTASPGYFVSNSSPARPALLELRGINMSAGFDPELHTYNFEPQDGEFSFGKAQAAGAIRFEVTSKRLSWTFNENFSACGGTSTWEWQEVFDGPLPELKWVLISDDCTGGGVATPPVAAGIDIGDQETTACDCSTAVPASSWRITLELVYEFEIAYLRAQIERLSAPTIGTTLFYRPQNTSDYVNRVNDRWSGNLHCGSTGVFNHLGATTFKYWKGVLSGTTYNDSFPTSLSSIASMLPKTILVTKVTQ